MPTESPETFRPERVVLPAMRPTGVTAPIRPERVILLS